MTSMTPQEEALKYLEKHRMIKLFDFLGAKIASQQPDDVNGFLKEEIQRIIEAKANGKKYTIFDEVDVNALFASFDITQRGYLTQLQYEKALLSLGIKTPNFASPKSSKIDQRTFVTFIMMELDKDSF